MKVTVVFEFPEMDIDGDAASQALDLLSKECERLREDMGADAVWVDDATCKV